MSGLRPTGDWRRVDGSQIHWVSSDGRIWSDKIGRLLSLILAPDGYYTFTLRRGTKVKVHRVVAATFIGPADEGLEVRHLNGNATDNRVENLAWGTRSQNILDCVAHGTHNAASKTHCKWGHEFTTENTRLEYKTRSGGRYNRICITCDRARGRAKYQRKMARLASEVGSAA